MREVLVVKSIDCWFWMRRRDTAIHSGHTPQHCAKVSRFLKLTTRKVIRSRNVRFLEKTFLQWAHETGIDLHQHDNLERGFDTSSDDNSDINDYFSNDGHGLQRFQR